MKLLVTTQAVDRNDSNLGFFHRWIEEFAKQCEQVTVICLREGEHALPPPVEVLSLGKERGTGRLEHLVLFFRYIVARRNRYDAVFVHMNPAYVILGSLLWRLWRKKTILWYAHKNVDLKLRVATLLAHHIATPSKKSFRLDTPKVSIVGHGIDTEIFHPEQRPNANEIRIVTAGRISRSKRLLEMLKVLDVLQARGEVFHFSVVGAPPTADDEHYEKELRAAIESKPYRDRVELRGGVPYHELPHVLAHQSIFLNLSLTGSLDKAVLDALAAGLAVVTSNEAFADSALPVLYAPFEPERYANMIEKLSMNPPNSHAGAQAVAHSCGLAQCIAHIIALT